LIFSRGACESLAALAFMTRAMTYTVAMTDVLQRPEDLPSMAAFSAVAAARP
jgi:hypothetical protein